MPANVFSRWWLFVFPFSLFIFFFLTNSAFSNVVLNSLTIPTFSKEVFLWLSDKLITQLPEGRRAGPNWEEINTLLLNVAWVLIVWRTALTIKSWIHQWTKKQVERLSAERNTALNKISDLNKEKEDIENHLRRIKRTVTTIITDNKLLKASCKAYEVTTLKSAKVNHRLKQKVKNLEKEAEIINNTLKMTAKLLQRRESSLQQKLAQEQILHQETETNLNSKLKAFQQDIIQMTMEREKTENSHEIQMKELREQSSDMERLLNAAKLESEKLRESCTAFQVQTTTSTEEMIRLKTSLDQDRKTHQDEINALKNKLEMITSLAQEKETTLQQKLDQEQTLHQETETKLSSKIKALELDIKEMSMEREKIGDSHKAEIKELLEHLVNRDKLVYTTQLEKEELKESCKAFEVMTTNLAEEMMGLNSSIEQMRKAHQDEMNTLQNKLDTMSIQMQDKETTFQQKLVEEEARTAQTNLKFAEYREEIKTVTKERQRYLKNEIQLYQGRAKDNLMAYRDSAQKLTRERQKTGNLQRRLDELNEKLSQTSQTPSCGKDDTAQSHCQFTSRRSDVDQDSRQRHERQPASRARRSTQKYFNERKYDY